MITSLTRSTDPSSWLAVTRAEMESQLVISADYEGSRTDSIIAASTQWVQDQTQQSLLRSDQAYTMTLDRWPTNAKNAVYLPFAPVYSAGTFTVNYVNAAGTGTPLTVTDDYIINDAGSKIPFITPTSSGWPSLWSSDTRDRITIVYTVGPASVPNWAKEAIKAYGTYLYEADHRYMEMAKSLIKNQRIHFDWKINE